MQKIAITLALAFALSLAGCIQNMGDLKDRFGATDDPAESQEETPASTTPTTPAANLTPPKPPVARISVFGANGALVYKATFTAEDPSAVVLVEEKSKLTLNAGDSEIVERGATLTGYAWSLNGKPLEANRTATVEVGEAGLYTLTLVVTDSKGSTDNQTVKLGVAPTPFEVVTELTSDPVVGAEGQGQAATLPFELALAGDKPATVQSVTFTATPGASCDIVFDVLDPDGKSLGERDSGSFGEEETITAGALPYGAYSLVVSPFVCAAPDGIPLTITVVYLPTVEGLATGDGHTHAH